MDKTMAFVPGYEEDVFVSYAHLDNGDRASPWVTTLADALRQRVGQILGVEVRVYRDVQLDPLERVKPKLQQIVSRSAALMSVVSPRYLKSEACTAEREWFEQAAKADGLLRDRTKSRVVRVIKTPSFDSATVPGWDDPQAFRFFDEDINRAPRIREFPSDRTLPRYPKFADEIEILSQSVADLLVDLQREATKRAAPKQASKKVFVANVIRELRQNYDDVCKELQDQGHEVRVLSLQSDASLTEIQDELQKQLNGCDLSLHLLGNRYGLAPFIEGSDLSLMELQYQVARSQDRAGGFRQLVWIPEEMPRIEERQAIFLDQIQDRDGGTSATDVIKGGLQRFKESVSDALKVRAVSVLPPNGKSVYFVCNQDDLSDNECIEMRRFLRRQGFRVALPVYEGDPGELRTWEEELVCERNATVIYWGVAKDSWVYRKRETILKALANIKERAARTRAIYRGVPDNPYKDELKREVEDLPIEAEGFSPLLVLGDCGPFQPEKIRPLLEALSGRRAGV
jgi:uncharacterized protein DUF4062/TIR domain-containing protein